MSLNADESIENLYSKLCLDLNMDMETKLDAWRSYEHIRKHYVLEGDQLHWLAVSLYVSCRRNRYLNSIDNNPISISRLLKSANNFQLIIFFDKLHKWEDMANLPDSIRSKIDQVEHAFNISSILFQKYPQIFLKIFGGNQYKLIYSDYQSRRTSNQINPKLNQRNKSNRCSHQDLYSLIWTIYALAKTIYPSTINDLIASFHLLIASFSFIYDNCKKEKLDYLLKGSCLNELCSYDGTIIDKLCEMYNCSSEMCRSIIDQHLKSELFKRFNNVENLLNEENIFDTIRDINRQYDEIVLTNCIIDERIFFENNIELNDFINSLNENRNSRSFQSRTPLTANQHLTYIDNQSNYLNINLTPISQANQLIQILNSIVQEQQIKPTNNLQIIIGQQTFLDDLIQRLNQWENIFLNEYNLKEDRNIFDINSNPSKSCQSRFDLSLKLFYYSLENILIIEKKRLISNQLNIQQIQQSFHKLILNNEFLKSLLGLCLLLVLYSHSDDYHDFNWILNIYSLHGYSFLKIIQIFLKTCKQISKSRSFIKYLSSIEERIISSMAFSNDSALWNEIKSKGILTYKQIVSIQLKTTSNSLSPINCLTPLFNQSPNKNNVSRKLFQSSSTTTNNNLSIIRSRSDPVVENSSVNSVKLCPYTMFYRKFYDLVLCRLDLLCLRLYGSQSNKFEKILWNLFLYLFENSTEYLFRSRDLDQILLSSIYYLSNSNKILNNQEQELTWHRLIQSYKSMPNSKLKTVRSVFIRSLSKNEINFNEENFHENPCLTPSKPAGTTHLIDGNLIGDIASFYKEVFLKIPNLEKILENILNDNQLIDIPIRTKTYQNLNSNSNNSHISINIGENIFVDYSSNKIQSNLYFNSNGKSNSSSTDNQINPSSNVLSSSIQAGAHNTVRTTRTRTEDGKFLTTISTISKLNNLNDNQDNIIINRNQTKILFGQSTNNSIKRTLSDDSNSNCLTSLTKKVLQIEKDRQKIEEY